MLNYHERKVLKYLQTKSHEHSIFNFKFINKMYDDFGGNLTKTLLSLEAGGFISLKKVPAQCEYISTYKTGNMIFAISGVVLNEEGLIYEIKYKKSLTSHFWFSFFLPTMVSVVATLITCLLIK